MDRDEATRRFGREVHGPLFAAFAQGLHAHLCALGRPESSAALFCARGGLRMRFVYETWLERTGCAAPVRTGDLMVSRIVAARLALERKPEIGLSEIGRNGFGLTVGSALQALASDLGPEGMPSLPGLDAKASGAAVSAVLSDPRASSVVRAIGRQNELFLRHLDEVSGSASTIALVDTGLMGSIVGSLRASLPGTGFVGLLYGRSSYGGRPAPHFDATFGIGFQSEGPDPRQPESFFLRHWHAVEDPFEPDLPSVASFREEGGAVVSNLEVPGWRSRVTARGNPLFDGLIDYLREAPRAELMQVADSRARAGRRLRQAVTRPSAQDVDALDVGHRSEDFGRPGGNTVLTDVEGLDPLRRLLSIPRALWLEGQARRAFPAHAAWAALALASLFGGTDWRRRAILAPARWAWRAAKAVRRYAAGRPRAAA